jgi:hypothetical protein
MDLVQRYSLAAQMLGVSHRVRQRAPHSGETAGGHLLDDDEVAPAGAGRRVNLFLQNTIAHRQIFLTQLHLNVILSERSEGRIPYHKPGTGCFAPLSMTG